MSFCFEQQKAVFVFSAADYLLIPKHLLSVVPCLLFPDLSFVPDILPFELVLILLPLPTFHLILDVNFVSGSLTFVI
jgi:hypothetical protein